MRRDLQIERKAQRVVEDRRLSDARIAGEREEADAEFNFTLDPCATAENAKCRKFFTKANDGLARDWRTEIVFCNPPYGRRMHEWARKCYESSLAGATVVLLAHARTDTRWFHDWVYRKAELRFLKGRLRFGDGRNSAPFPSLVAVYSAGGHHADR